MIAALIRYLGRFTAGSARATTRRRGQPPRRQDPSAEPQPSTDGIPGSRGSTTASADQTERMLVAALLAGLIEPAEYRESMAVLARADDAGRPLHVPSA
ncbi:MULTISPECIES: hypothetical protein [unclassified Kitasatospora]|uniref:hypothetical protein n=1 Tax=unclassified Kitasatospora TaxID=2633591 RepID=UPI0033C5FB6D